MAEYIVYYRIPTLRRSNPDLSLPAQKSAVRDFLGDIKPRLEITEIEPASGPKDHRPELVSALDECRLTGATLLIAKLDGLLRNAAILQELSDADVEIAAADMPEVDRVMIKGMALAAEREAQAISARTKAGLAAAKERGMVLGGFRGVKVNQALGVQARQAKADAYVQGLADIFRSLAGARVPAIQKEMMQRGILTPGGGKVWTYTTTMRAVERFWRLNPVKNDARH
mgnify:CR=1 FL=1